MLSSLIFHEGTCNENVRQFVRVWQPDSLSFLEHRESCCEAFMLYSSTVSGERENAFWHALGHVICVTFELSYARLDHPHPR